MWLFKKIINNSFHVLISTSLIPASLTSLGARAFARSLTVFILSTFSLLIVVKIGESLPQPWGNVERTPWWARS